jgi:hypothetical protein
LLFYSPGLAPGRIALPLDVLCWQLPWANMPVCQGISPRNVVISDVVLQFHPWRATIRHDGWGGALWNTYLAAGSPMLGNGQSAPFYPLNWLHDLLPPAWSYWLSNMLRTLVAAGFTWAFARRRFSAEASALAAVTYAFSFTFVSSISIPFGDTLTWLPALLWAVSPVRVYWLGIFTAIELLAGQPESAIIVAGIVGTWWMWDRLTRGGTLAEIRREIGKVSIAVGAGLIVALPALWPFLRYLTNSAAGLFRAEYNPMFYSAHTLLELLTPEFFGSATPSHSWGSNPGGFFGLLPFLLASAWIAARPREAARNPFLWVFAASLCFIYQIPPLSWLLRLPHLRTIYVSKFWAPVTFAGAMLAAAALDEYRRRRFPIWWTGAATALCAAGAWWTFRDFIVALQLQRLETWVAVKVIVALAAALAVLRLRPSAAAVVAFAELALYLVPYNTTAPRELFYPSTPAIDFLKKDPSRFRIMGDGVLPACLSGVFGLEDVRGYDAITYQPYFQYMTRIDPAFPDLASRLDLTSLATAPINRETLFVRDRFLRPLEKWDGGYRDFLHRAYYWNQQLTRVDQPRLLDLLNVKYYLVGPGARLPPGIEDYQLAYSGEVDIYRNSHVLPRAHVDGDGTRARITVYGPTEVVVEARGPGLLVLADTMYPGWRAPGYTIEVVEGLFRGVRLPPGDHVVRFSFHAWAWK